MRKLKISQSGRYWLWFGSVIVKVIRLIDTDAQMLNTPIYIILCDNFTRIKSLKYK